METLFHLSPEELSKICVEAKFDEKQQLIIDQENCIHQNGFMLFKQPIYAKRGRVLGGITGREIIIKRTKEDSTQIYLFAMTETSSDNDDALLYNFFDSENCDNKGCMILKTRSANWMPGSYLMEVDSMETLFHLTTEELSKICMEAEFDERYQFIIDEENCIRQNGVIFFKRPIHILYEDFICEILDTLAIIKDDDNSRFVFMFAMTEIKTEKTSDVLCDFYDSGNGLQNDCYCMHTHNKGWRLGNRIWEVQDEEM